MSLRGVTLHIIAVCLLIAFCLSPLQPFWQSIDEKVFLFANISTIDHPLQQAFWALGTTHGADIFIAIFLIGAFLVYIFEDRDEKRMQKLAQLLFTGFWTAATILISKLCISPLLEAVGLARESPSSVYDHSQLLSTVTPWVNVKDIAFNCFPSDHATVIFQWCAFFWFFAGFRKGLLTTIIALAFLLPRIISGAHWICDMIVGSGAITAIVFAWAFLPLMREKGLRLASKLICTIMGMAKNRSFFVSPLVSKEVNFRAKKPKTQIHRHSTIGLSDANDITKVFHNSFGQKKDDIGNMEPIFDRINHL
jgi:membrane-associated phospholipid phosphatase